MPLGIGGVGHAVGEAFRFFTQKGSADNKERNYRLDKVKDADKCMNCAEQLIFALDNYYGDVITKKQLKFIYHKYKKIFFQNN